jgi:hypothetical protein
LTFTPASFTVKVGAATSTQQATSLSVEPASGTYGGTTDLKATLKTSNGSALANKSVDFNLAGSPAGSDTTDASGVAELNDVALGSTNAGTLTDGVTANFAGDTGYKASNNSNDLTVGKAALTVTAQDASRAYGAQDPTFAATYSGFVNDETESVLDGTLAFATDATASSPVGNNYTITPSGLTSNSYNISFVNGTLEITKAQATLSLSNLSHTYNGSPQEATVTTTPAGLSGVSVTYGGSATAPTNAGSYSVVASLDNPNYQALDATDTLVINKASQAITFGALSTKTYGDADFQVSATGGASGNPVTFTAVGNCTSGGTNGSTISITGAGSCTVTASQAGNSNYLAATPVERSFTINKANQSITFNPPASKNYDDGSFDLSASATSGLAVNFTSLTTNVCTVSGNTVSILSKGDCTIKATQAGNNNYNPADPVEKTIKIAGWTTGGFYQPVDMGILNNAKAGSTVPLKFEVWNNSGVEQTSTSIVKSFTQKISCAAGTGDDIEAYSSGSTVLRYDTTAGQFIFNWQTPKAAGSCYRVTLTTSDGSTLTADFRLR